MSILARLAIFVATVAAPVAAQFSGIEWGLYGSGSVDHMPQATVSGEHVHLLGLTNSFCEPTKVWVQSVAGVDGHVSFTAVFTYAGPLTPDDAPVAFLDGSFVTPPGSGWPSGLYPFDFDVQAGQSFGFGIAHSSCFGPPGTVDVSDFTFTPTTWLQAPGAIDPRLWLDVPAPPGAEDFGATLGACGDVDGDGHGDVAVGAPASGGAFVVSGADGSLALELALAPDADLRVTGAGDFDDDGVPDLLVGRPHAGLDAGRVEVRSGIGGALLAWSDGPSDHALLGWSVAPAGDVDGDGYLDVLAGAPGDWLHPLVDGAAVLVHGPAGLVTQSVEGNSGFGVAVAAPNVGGAPLVCVATSGLTSSLSTVSFATGSVTEIAEASWSSVTACLAPCPGGPGAALVWGLPTHGYPAPTASLQNGHVWLLDANGGESAHWPGSNFWDFVGDVVASGDWNGDGIADAGFVSVVGDSSGYSLAPRVRIASGAAGGPLLHELKGSSPGFGRALANLGDIDGDGIDDLAIGGAGGGAAVRFVHALDGHGVPRLQGSGELVPDGPFDVLLSDARPNAPVTLVAGLEQVNLPLKGGLLVPSEDVIVALVTDGAGAVAIHARWPAGIVGPFTFWSQAWLADSDAAHGFSASAGLGGFQP